MFKNFRKKILGIGYWDSLIGGIFSSFLFFPISKIFLFFKDKNIVPKRVREGIDWGVRRAVTIHPKFVDNLLSNKALILYWSGTGNTEKTANAIEQGIRKAGLKTKIKKISDSLCEDYYDYDLVCFGTPVYDGLPPKPVINFVQNKFREYRQSPSEIRVPARRIPGKNALVFVTFSGHHVGIDEALPAGKYIVQEFEHLGFEIVGEWYIVGEHHGWTEGSIRGRLGNIKGRPTAEDLNRIEEETIKLVKSLIRAEKSKESKLISLSKIMTVFSSLTIKKMRIVVD